MEVAKQNTGLKKSVAEWAKASCSAHYEAKMAGQGDGGLSYTIASNTIMKVRNQLFIVSYYRQLSAYIKIKRPIIYSYFLPNIR